MEGINYWRTLQGKSLEHVARDIANELHTISETIVDKPRLPCDVSNILIASRRLASVINLSSYEYDPISAAQYNAILVRNIGLTYRYLQQSEYSFLSLRRFYILAWGDPVQTASVPSDLSDWRALGYPEPLKQCFWHLEHIFCRLLSVGRVKIFLSNAQSRLPLEEVQSVTQHNELGAASLTTAPTRVHPPGPDHSQPTSLAPSRGSNVPQDQWRLVDHNAGHIAVHQMTAISTVAHPHAWPNQTDSQGITNQTTLDAANSHNAAPSSNDMSEIDWQEWDRLFPSSLDQDSTARFRPFGMTALTETGSASNQRLPTITNPYVQAMPERRSHRGDVNFVVFPKSTAESEEGTYILQQPTQEISNNNILAAATPARTLEGDSPWSEREGLPPPYELSPRVLFERRLVVSANTPAADSPQWETDGPAPPYALSPGVFTSFYASRS
jgi:hypothetical protein